MVEIKIRENEAGQRLDKYLHKYLTEAPGSFLYKMLRKKNITLNGSRASGSEMLHNGDQVQLFLADDTVRKFGGIVTEEASSTAAAAEKTVKTEKQVKTAKQVKTEKQVPAPGAAKDAALLEQYQRAGKEYGSLKVIYESHDVMVVDKPSGVLTQKAKPEELSLNEWLIGELLARGEIAEEELHTFRPSVCNRLDRNTSGMVICGKTLAGSRNMSLLLKERSLRKYYRLYVRGRITEPARIAGYLVKDERTNRVTVSKTRTKDASYIETAYKPIKNYREMTLLEVELITGKTHQIRAHLAGTGHPLLGDYKYGDRDFNDRYKKKYQVEHQLLHAYRLEFPLMEEECRELSGLVLTDEPPDIFRRIDASEME